MVEVDLMLLYVFEFFVVVVGIWCMVCVVWVMMLGVLLYDCERKRGFYI